MKLVSLNTWGGKVYKPLIKFIKDQSSDTDIFCFQEVFNTSTKNVELNGYRLNLYDEISAILKDFKGYYAPTQDRYVFYTGFVDFEQSYGLAIFARKNLPIESYGDFFVFGKRNDIDPENIAYTMPKNLQHISFSLEDRQITLCNYHGIWVPGPKIDTPSRIEQSKKINKFLKEQSGGEILCGDLNLDLNTESVTILEEEMINLIRKFNIKSTRGRLHNFEIKYADYIFVSPGIKIIDFKLPDLKISDHLPMILEFS